MADQETPDLDLNTLIPLLQSRQNQDAATQQSKAALGLAGRIAAPNLYDMVTNPKPSPGPLPPPGTVGKVPEQGGSRLDPRAAGAFQEIGALGLGGMTGRLAGPALGAAAKAIPGTGLEAATQAASRLGTAANEAGPTRALIGAGLAADPSALTNPTGQAQAATRLTPEQKQEIEKAKQLQTITNQGNAAAIEAQNKSNLERMQAEGELKLKSDAAAAEQKRKDQEAQAILDRQLKQQAEADAEAKAKKEREQPFVEAHPMVAKSLPAVGTAAATMLPAWMKMRGKAPLEDFVKNWAAADKAAKTALKGNLKQPAVTAALNLKDFENKWPEMEQRFTPGWKTNAAAGFVPAELAAVPTEYDFTQPKGSPSRPTMDDVKEAAARSAGFGALGIAGSKLGPAMVNPVAPYTGGGGTVEAYQRKYPPTKRELAAEAARATLPTLPQAPTKAMLPAVLNKLRGK